MPQLTVLSYAGAAVVVLPQTVLESFGLQIGDTLDLTVGDGQLILRPANDAERRRLMADLSEEVMKRRKDAYQRLA